MSRETKSSENNTGRTPRRRSNTLPIRQLANQSSEHSNSTSGSSDAIDLTDGSCGNNIGIEAAVQEFNANTSRKRYKRKEPNIRECPDCKTVREIKCRGRCVPCYATYLNVCKRADTSQHKKCSECKKVRPVNYNNLCVTCSDKRRRLERGIVNRCKVCKKICKKMLGDKCFKCQKKVAQQRALNGLHYKNCLQCNKWASCTNDDLCSECSNGQTIAGDAARNSATRSIHPTDQSSPQYRHGVFQILSSDDEQEHVDRQAISCSSAPRMKRPAKKKRAEKSCSNNDVDEVITIESTQQTSEVLTPIYDQNVDNQEEMLFQQQSTPRSLDEQLNQSPIELSDIIINRQRDQLNNDQSISPVQLPRQTTPTRTPFMPTNSDVVQILNNWQNMFVTSSNIHANVSGPIHSPSISRTIPQRSQPNNNQVDQVQPAIKVESQQSANYEDFGDEIMIVESQEVENTSNVLTTNRNDGNSTIEINSEDEERFNTPVAFKVEPNIKAEYQDFTNEVVAMSQRSDASKSATR